MTAEPGGARRAVVAVIVSYNTADLLVRAIDSLRAEADAAPHVDLRVVVVDNASTDHSVDAVQRAHPEITVVANRRNVGFGAACNQGAAMAPGADVLLVNPDAVVESGTLGALVDHVQRHPEHGLYGGLTTREDGTPWPFAVRRLPTMWSDLCFATGLSTVFSGSTVFDPEPVRVGPDDLPHPVEMITGSLLHVSRAAWDRLGGFDERFFLYGEDADLCRRAADLGYRPVLVPGAAVIHDGGAATPDTGVKHARQLIGKATYLALHESPLRRVVRRNLLVCGAGLRAAAGLVSGRMFPWRTAFALRRWWKFGYRTGHPLHPPTP